MKYILSIDPGGKPPNGTTGVALFSIGARVELVDTWAIEGGAYESTNSTRHDGCGSF